MTRTSQSEREEARERLLEEPFALRAGDTLYTILRHVSRSGMSRRIGVVKPYLRDDGEIDFVWLDYNVARALGLRPPTDDNGIRRDGCGMDMGFDLVYSLSWTLFGDGYALKQRWL